MKSRPVRTFIAVLIVIGVFLMTPGAYAAATPPAPQDLQQKVAEALEPIKSYSAAQRDQAVARAKAVLEEFDARINALESQLNQKWVQMDQTARQEAASAMAALRKQRNAAAEWDGGLKHGSRQAWEDVKTGFSKSAHDLEDAFRKAYSDL